MENNSLLFEIKSKYCLELIFSYINENIKLKLLSHSKVFQKKCGMTIENYKIKFYENLKKIKNTEKIKIYDKLNLIKYESKHFFFINSIENFFNPLPEYWSDNTINNRILPELKNLKKDFLVDEGFQIYGIKENKLIGVIEGPLGTLYENGFFIFELIISKNYPFELGKFYFKTKVFHPNIGEDGYVFLDIFEKEWTPALTFRTIILSVQSLLDSPNPDEFLNENASKLYKEKRYLYEKMVKDYIMKYANFISFEDKLSKYELNIEHIEI